MDQIRYALKFLLDGQETFTYVWVYRLANERTYNADIQPEGEISAPASALPFDRGDQALSYAIETVLHRNAQSAMKSGILPPLLVAVYESKP